MARGATEIAADNAAVVARLCAVLANAPFCDTTLVSERDGTKTAAAAIMLASCSPVFLKMLTGSFAEGAARRHKKTKTGDDADTASLSSSAPAVSCSFSGEALALVPVSCSFSGEALAAVVTFAATNDAPALWDGTAELLAEILEASEYYDIDGLRVKARRQLVARAREVPAEACEVLAAVWERWAATDFEDGSAGEVAEAALLVVDESADLALAGCGCLCEEAMEKVLHQESICTTEVGMFRALERWVCVDEATRKISGERLASCVSLELMPPSFLLDVVDKSGLVSKEVIFDILAGHALGAEAEHGFDLRERNSSALTAWLCSETDLTDEIEKNTVNFLDRSVGSGCWSWVLYMEAGGDGCAVGVANGDRQASERLGTREGAYAYPSDGDCHSDGPLLDQRGPRFSQGDHVRVTLDCDVGTLSISVNDGELYEAFAWIPQIGDIKVFRPAMWIVAPGRIRLLEFSRLLPS